MRLKFVKSLIWIARRIDSKGFDDAIDSLVNKKAYHVAVKYIRAEYMAEGLNLCANINCMVTKPLMVDRGRYFCKDHYKDLKMKSEGDTISDSYEEK